MSTPAEPYLEVHPVALALSIVLAVQGVAKGSLALSGGFAAALMGYAHLANPNPTFGYLLLAFYIVGSRATKVKAGVKAKLEREQHQGKASSSKGHGHKASTGGQRDALQVLCNALPAAVAAATYRLLFSTERGLQGNVVRNAFGKHWSKAFLGDVVVLPCSSLSSSALANATPSPNLVVAARMCLLFALGHYACCMGDVLASELGILSRSPPRLITNLARIVPPGTNGGVSLIGTGWSAAGGLFIGLVTFAADVLLHCRASDRPVFIRGLELALLGSLAGFTGSMIDSVLGATLQRTWYSRETKQVLIGGPADPKRLSPYGKDEEDWIVMTGANVLSNNAVNIVSAVATATLTAFAGWLLL
ncbi:hypothetical protein K437DRAFT_253389 [Tilletiaria anomala UBC 951]|uniref:DUF92-domain-containing protein n=1 Tax=Tilletiaria anomala (strain ATCC 24038 / CBS 436.72 / UBC 951) TaxID=1037660 RepID=A0A066WQZ3_TILAU|nr:uncharacterized protein K437DRAFT_253389 [Tilletiaria anomala UBC 951]KDN53065.1 hypothetical protein K437DRAFT_253389 [Tilletiaria anomala UBC 951]